MIPPFTADGNLPPGIHAATLDEVEARFAWNRRRVRLTAGLRAAARALTSAGCKRLYVDGSFVTTKEFPEDFDGCWEVAGVDLAKLDPILKIFAARRLAQKMKYRGELFPNTPSVPADAAGTLYLEFFQADKSTGKAKGIVAIDL